MLIYFTLYLFLFWGAVAGKWPRNRADSALFICHVVQIFVGAGFAFKVETNIVCKAWHMT